MSHFKVIVVHDQPLDQATLALILQPWHEYECTGIEDEYVVDVDVTDEVKADHEKYGEGRDLVAFAQEWGDYQHRDGRFFDRTNPNKKWDWWVVGGRYSDSLRTKDGRLVDVARRGDLDLDFMKIDRQRERRDYIAECMVKSEVTREELERGALERERAHAEWLELPEPRPRQEAYTEWLRARGEEGALAAKIHPFYCPETDGRTLDQWIDEMPPLSCYAFVRGGTWNERGQMGWFGMSSGDLPREEWEAVVGRMLDEVPKDYYLAVVDCHI